MIWTLLNGTYFLQVWRIPKSESKMQINNFKSIWFLLNNSSNVMDKLLCVVLRTTALVQIMLTNSHVVWSVKRSNAVDGVTHIVNMDIYFHSLAKNNLFWREISCSLYKMCRSIWIFIKWRLLSCDKDIFAGFISIYINFFGPHFTSNFPENTYTRWDGYASLF